MLRPHSWVPSRPSLNRLAVPGVLTRCVRKPFARHLVAFAAIGLLTVSCTGQIAGGMLPTPTEVATAGNGPVSNPMSEPPLERGLLTSCDETKSGPPPQ